ncbi:ARC6/PARC6 family protein [Synechocystis sp. B12]|nr:ARC6/PARC6 family protein [Synechocystis sp. B12]
MWGATALIINRTGDPLGGLLEDPLDVFLDQPSEFIPDEATSRNLILSQPNFNQQVGQMVVQGWLDSKKLAFGQNYDVGALQSVLAPNLLAQQRGQAQRDQAQKVYHQYEHKLQILAYQVNPQDPNRATVTARVEEISQPFTLGNQQQKGSATKDDLTVRYQLVRHQGVWKIDQIQVVNGPR